MGRGENPDDLFQVGCIGLLKAIANFDTSKQVRFSTYGVPMIAGELRRYLRDYSPIRVSRSVRDTAYRVLQCKQELVEQNGREPTMRGDCAARWTFRWKRSSARWTRSPAPVSLYEPVYSDGGDPLTVMDQVRDTKNTDERWLELHCHPARRFRSCRRGKNGFWRCGFMTAGRRWRLPAASASRRRRSRGWKKTRSAPSAGQSACHKARASRIR